MMTIRLLSIAALAVGLIFACGKEGKELGVPKIEPPVKNNLPLGFSSTSLNLSSGLMTTLKDYLSSDGNGPGPVKRFKKIDDRIQSLNKRAAETARKCQESGVKSWTAAGLPELFTQKYQCLENLNSTSQLAFGKDSSSFYLVERQNGDEEKRLVYAKTNLAGTETEAWQIEHVMSDHNGQEVATMIHIKGSDELGGIEASGNSSQSEGFALSCKFQLKTNKDYIYITGQTSVNYTCQDITDNCFKTGDLQVTDASNCTGAGLNSFTLASIESVDVAAVKAAMEKKISGFVNFNDDAN